MSKRDGSDGKAARGGGAGKAPGRDKMVGTKNDKWGSRPLPRSPRTILPRPSDIKGKGKDTYKGKGKGRHE